MGLFPPTPTLATATASPENSTSNYRVYASFCLRSPTKSDSNASNWIESYNPSDNTWSHVGTIPGLTDNHVLKGFAMVAVRDAVYVIGGRLCRKDGGDNNDEADVIDRDLAVLPTVLQCNVHTNEWSQCAPLSTPRFDFACTVYDDKIYVAGGQCTLGCARGISFTEVYDPALDEWNSLPNMSTLRYKCVGVTWQEKIYVVGGFAERGDSNKTVPFMTERSCAEVFDTQCGEWDLKLGMWQLDVPPNQIVAIDNRLYSSGDCLNTWKGHIEAYDGKLNIWNIIEQSDSKIFSSQVDIDTSDATESNGLQIQRMYLTMAPVGTHLYFLAGYRLPGEFSRSMSAVHRFDTSAAGDAWSSCEPIEEGRDKELCGHCCVVQVS